MATPAPGHTSSCKAPSLRQFCSPPSEYAPQECYVVFPASQTAQRQEESIVGHAFSRPLVQHLSLSHLIQAFEQTPDIVVLETNQAVILPSSEEYWRRYLEIIVRADY